MKTFILVAVSLVVGIAIGKFIGESSFGLPGYQFYTKADYVRVQGTWIADSQNSTFTENTFRTSEISCYRDRALCLEARAIKADATGNILAMVLEYEVKVWDSDKTIAVLDAAAAVIEIKFDKIKEVVTLIATEKSENKDTRQLPSYAHLDDGWKVAETLF